MLSGGLSLSLCLSMTLSHPCKQALVILTSLVCQSVLAPSCWVRDTPVLSPSQMCTSLPQVSQRSCRGAEVSGTRLHGEWEPGEPAGGAVRDLLSGIPEDRLTRKGIRHPEPR